MNKIKLTFGLLLISGFLIILLLLLMKPEQKQTVTGNLPIPPTANRIPPTPGIKPPIKQPVEPTDKTETENQESSTQPPKEETESVETVGVAVEPSEEATEEVSSDIPEPIKEMMVFEHNFGRNIFQERIELDTPILEIEKYEDPDTDGTIMITWNPIKLAAEYDLDVNGNIRSQVTSPFMMTDLTDGEYFVRCIAKNLNGTSKWSKVLRFKVYKPQIVHKAKKENIRLNFYGVIKKKGKFLALIDDKLYKVGDILKGGTITEIKSGSLKIQKKGNDYVFTLQK